MGCFLLAGHCRWSWGCSARGIPRESLPALAVGGHRAAFLWRVAVLPGARKPEGLAGTAERLQPCNWIAHCPSNAIRAHWGWLRLSSLCSAPSSSRGRKALGAAWIRDLPSPHPCGFASPPSSLPAAGEPLWNKTQRERQEEN